MAIGDWRLAMAKTTKKTLSGGPLLSLPSVSPILLIKSSERRHQPSANQSAPKKPQISNPRTLTLKIPAAPKPSLKVAIATTKIHPTKKEEESNVLIKGAKQIFHTIRSLPQNSPGKLRSGKSRRYRERLKARGCKWHGESGPTNNRALGDIPMLSVSSTVIREMPRSQRGGLRLELSASCGVVGFKGERVIGFWLFECHSLLLKLSFMFMISLLQSFKGIVCSTEVISSGSKHINPSKGHTTHGLTSSTNYSSEKPDEVADAMLNFQSHCLCRFMLYKLLNIIAAIWKKKRKSFG